CVNGGTAWYGLEYW
nr:immunoglobulin heavy chain junction region [Macaca mulatta]